MVNGVQVSGGDPGVFSQTHKGLAVVGKTVQLKPGAQVAIDYHVVTGNGQTGTPILRVTPLIWERTSIHTPSRCG
jgi:hypothetical protein